MKKTKQIFIAIAAITGIAIAILLPFILNALYLMNPPSGFFDVGFANAHSGYEPGELLEYYGVVLSFVTTAILTIVVIIQTKRANEKAEEVNALMLKLQEQQLQIAKEQFEREKRNTVDKQNNADRQNNAPKFEISITGYNGNYANLRLKIKNVSSIIASALKGIKFEITDNDGEVSKYTDGTIIPRAKRYIFKKKSLISGESTGIEIDTPDMRKEGNVWNTSKNQVLPKDVSMKFSFSCEDESGKTHYYEATRTIPDTKEFCDEPWDCKKVG